MRFCPKCNQELDDEASFCTKCGARQEHKCAVCGAELVLDSKFCNKCGKAVNNEEILQKQNTLQYRDSISNNGKNKIDFSSIHSKSAIIVVILVVISLIGYFNTYGSSRNFVNIKLDRGVSVKIPKDWENIQINKIHTERPGMETLLSFMNISNNDYFVFSIVSDQEDNLFSLETLKNISKDELYELSTIYIKPIENYGGFKIKHKSYLLKTQKNILRYPSVYHYNTFSIVGKENMISYNWKVAAHNQTLNILLYYDMDTYPNNELFKTIVNAVLPSLIIQ